MLPKLKDPKDKPNVFKLLKDLIGKDLSRISMPVYLNEPISMLQRFSELWAHYDLLNIANNEANEYKRIAYVNAFVFMTFCLSVSRQNKPFNPLLGETYEYRDGDLKTIAEQVSHHPPISAIYGENENFIVECFIEPKSKFGLTKLEVSPRSNMKIFLKSTKEVFTVNRPQSSVHNIFSGDVYVWNFGSLECKNVTTGAYSSLKFKNHPMWGSLDYSVQGEIRDKSGSLNTKITCIYYSMGIGNMNLI
jgi:hypothetical protein